MSAAIEALGISRVYRAAAKRGAVRAVDRVELEVQQGEVVALLGPNGAGKTTKVRMLTCLLRPTEGTARICGHDVRESPGAVRAACGVSMESPGLYERLTAADYLTFFARLYDLPDHEVKSRVEVQLRSAGLWDRRDDLLVTFSKGMRQKMNIARALVHGPRAVFLDEPTTGLDVEAASAVREHIMAMRNDAETTFFLCTHNLPEAERLCDRIAVMNSGKVVAMGRPEELERRLFGERVMRACLRELLPKHCEAVKSVPGVSEVRTEGNEVVFHLSESESEVNPRLVRALVDSGAEVISFASEGRSLEDVYLRLMDREAESGEAGS